METLRYTKTELIWWYLAKCIEWLRTRIPGDYGEKLVQGKAPIYSRFLALEMYCYDKCMIPASKRAYEEWMKRGQP